jgi:hypothetical protein
VVRKASLSSTMAPPSSDIEISNYDVLADVVTTPISEDESDIGLSLAAHSYHVGNNRLEVLCNMHSNAYSDHQAKGGEFNSAAIVEKIMDIVQNQCVPKGRFLQRGEEGEWSIIEVSKARLLVRQTLSNITQHNEAPGRKETPQTEDNIQQKQEADAEKKRRRRSSLLRRSVSSSMLPSMMSGAVNGKPFDDKKKAIRKALDLSVDGDSPDNTPANSRSSSPELPPEKTKTSALPAFGRSRTVEVGSVSTQASAPRPGMALNIDRKPIVKETLKMDVLMNTTKTALLPGTDLHGNNRLNVMVTLQSPAYKAADEEGQTKIATDLVGTIENFWGGRIMAQVPTRKGRRGGKEGEEAYVKLDAENAVSAMKHLLSGNASEEDEDENEEKEGEIRVPRGRRASLKAIQSIGAVTTGGKSSILPSTLPALPADMQHLRSAAVKSLQKRKQRQGLNSRIRGLTADKAAIFQDGNGNAGSVSPTCGTTGAPGPIPTTITSALPNQVIGHNFEQYRLPSSGASVASTVTHLSNVPPAGGVQRQPSLGGVSTASSNTQMSRNTVNAARTISNINPGHAHYGMHTGVNMPMNMVHNQGMGVVGAELHIPTNIIASGTGPHHQYQQPHSMSMPPLPEEFNAAYAGMGFHNTDQLNQGVFPPDQGGRGADARMGRGAIDRNSLLNSTGSDGVPRLSQGEFELLIKGLEMGENQQE